MPAGTIEERQRRRDAIAKLVERRAITRQSELVDLLRNDGITATQSSVSRDLKEMGVTKEPTGYRLPTNGAELQTQSIETVTEFVRSLRPAGPHLLVLRTAIGAAQRVGLVLDRLNWDEIVGTLSGDDTIFIATASAADQRRVSGRLKSTLSVTNR
jgi:transcriptional regulator of arginine metabolism